MTEQLLAAGVYNRLQQAMASDPQGFRDLYREYLADARHAVADLRTAFLQQNFDNFRQRAHYLKSGSAVLGVVPLSTASAEMEEMGRSRDLSGAEDKLAAATRILDEVEEELALRLGRTVIPRPGEAA